MRDTLTLNETVAQTTLQCLHCQQPIGADAVGEFCCQGCQSVYQLLNACGLAEYYELRKKLGSFRPAQAVGAFDSQFAYLDDPEQVQPLLEAQGERSLNFYLEGVHCAACLWLIEKLPEYLPGLASVRLNLATATAKVTLSPQSETRFEEVAQLLMHWGYRPHLLRQEQDQLQLARKEQTLLLSRIGVAAFAAGNLMILAVALYSGIKGSLADYFEWLSLGLALPAVTFSAWPFYRQAWSQIRYRHQISIDLPIALSIIIGSLGGVYELLWGSHQLYFDSLAMLVFLLLFSRYALLRTQQQVLSQDRLMAYYSPETVTKITEQGPLEVPLAQLQAGDKIQLGEGQRLPADGIVLAGQAQVDLALLTGEAYPQSLKVAEAVYCGSRILSGSLLVQIQALGAQTRLGQILTRSQHNLEEKTQLVRLADSLARRFVSLVLALMGLVCLVFISHPQEALVRVLALAIISCPCALALATPLMVQISLKQALAKGFFVRKAESLERIPEIRELVFDKTGTLTMGRFELLKADFKDEPQALQGVIVALERHSAHPIARALLRSFANQPNQSEQPEQPQAPEVHNFRTLSSGGIAAEIEGQSWQLVPVQELRQQQNPGVQLQLLCEGQLKAELTLGDQIRPDAAEIISQLKAMGYQPWLLSGDQPQACQLVAKAVGIPAEQVLAAQSPEAKERFLEAHSQAMMIGDGINDMMAMTRARVGVSVQGAADENLQSADIYLAEQGIAQLPGLLRHARITRQMMKATLGFSLSYNLLGMTAALLGLISPLAAAILMPLSALTVLSLSLIGGRRLCKS